MEEPWPGLYITKKNHVTFSDQRIYLYELSVARLQPSTGKKKKKKEEKNLKGCSLATESSCKKTLWSENVL